MENFLQVALPMSTLI